MTDTELQGVVDTLRAQRNGALDAIAQLNGTIAELQDKIKKMEETKPEEVHVPEVIAP